MNYTRITKINSLTFLNDKINSVYGGMMVSEIIKGIIITVLTAGSVALSTYAVKTWWACRKKHKADHSAIAGYPEMLEKNKKVHVEIKQLLEWNNESNVSQHRAQLLQIYDEAKLKGSISRHWYYQFDEQYKLYTKMGGNGPVEAMKKELDEMYANQKASD